MQRDNRPGGKSRFCDGGMSPHPILLGIAGRSTVDKFFSYWFMDAKYFLAILFLFVAY